MRGVVVVAVLAAAMTLLIPSSGLAVHDLGLLELDTTAPGYANTADNSAPVAGSNAPYDWESIFDSNGQQTLTSAMEPRLLLASFSSDAATPDASYFASSNKDTDNVSTWECGSVNNPTPKDEISNAYSALFLNSSNNHVILYAAGERDSNNGNSFMGFWIFKSAVGCNSPGMFSGHHTDGDILVLSNFTGGGNHPLVEVYQWSTAVGGLSPIDSGNFCHAAAAGDAVCGEVNGTPFQTAWAPHDTAASPLEANEFLEVGVDLTSALDFTVGSIPCFTTFQAETRSSQETSATLKDYAARPFNTCTSNTVTTPKAGGTSVSGATVAPGTQVTDQAVITGSGLVGTSPGPTGSVSFFLCGPQSTQAQAQCQSGGTPVLPDVNLPPGDANPKTVSSSAVAPTAPGWYCFRAVYSGDANYAGGSADSSLNECFQVAQLTPNVTTNIHNAAHAVVTAVEAGATVHDSVTVTGAAATPSGNVTFDWFTNGTCAGAPASTSANVALANGQADATGFAKGPLAAGRYAFRAHYLGDTVYVAGAGPCEPLEVVDANIQITPGTATNRIGHTHTFTAHVNVNDGTGFTNAPDGTAISFQIDSGPGSFTSANPCITSGGTGSCTITLSSNATGVTTVSASTTLQVGTLSLTRSTNGIGANSAPAAKTWVNARISIASSATNEIGRPHTFTVTLEKDTGTGSFVPAQGEHVDVVLTDSSGAAHAAATGTCTNGGANTNTNGQCTITFASGTPGKVTARASATLTIVGLPVTVETDGTGQNSPDAVKTFVDANIQISPANAINPVSTNHTLTGHVNVNDGSGAFTNAPDGTTITFTLTGAAAFVGPSSCATSAGSCTVVISSAAVGASTIKASTDVTVGGVTLHRETNDSQAGDSPSASKLWADDTARTDILNASGNVVTTVVSGTIVHDKVFVARAAGTPDGVPDPTGSVVFHRYATIDCTGTAIDQSVGLTAGSPSTALSADFAPTSNMSYRAAYSGDANYPARTGACEPLTVTPAPAPAIAIVKNPKGQTVAVGGTATFSITVTNAGNTPLTDVTVTDPLSPNCSRTKVQIPELASMAPGATVTYTCTKPNVRGNFDNVATATGTPPSGANVTATDTAPVKVKALLPEKKVTKKKPKVVSHKKPKATG